MEPTNLRREISNTNLLFISFAAIFGSGWLFAPFYAAQIAGPASLVSWFLGIVMSAVIGVTIAEVITLFPQSGGLISTIGITHGVFLSLVVTVLNLLVFIILPAIEVRAILQYSASYFKFLMTTETEFSFFGYLLAILLLMGVTLVNLLGAKITGRITKFLVIFKIITPLIICATFLYTLRNLQRIDHAQFSGFFPLKWSSIFEAIATSGIIFSFNGFNQATLFAGEARDPKKAIPFAIIGSLILSGALYLLIQYTFLLSVPKENLSQGWAHLSFPGDQGPFAGIAVTLGLSWILIIIYADAIFSPLGTAFSYASSAPRLLFSLGETHSFFRKFQTLNSFGISGTAVLVTLALEILAFIFLPSLKAMISILVAAFVLCYTTAPASLLKLRKTHPHLKRPFQIYPAGLLCYLSLFFSNLMVFSCGWIALRNLMSGFAILFVFFIFLRLHHKKERPPLKPFSSAWFFFQLASIAAISYLSQNSGTPFEISVIGIALISGIALLWSSLGRNSDLTSIE